MSNLVGALKLAQENRAAAFAKVDAFNEKLEKRTWVTETDGPALDAAKAELLAAENEVRTIEGQIEIQNRTAGWTFTPTTNATTTVNVITSRGDSVEEKRKSFRIIDAINQAVSGKPMTGLAAEMDQEGKKEARSSGLDEAGSGAITLPAFLVAPAQAERRDITATTTTTGGHTIATELGPLITFLDPRLTVRDMGATYLPGLVGNMDFPRNDAASTAVWAAENATSTETTPTFDKLSMSPKRVTATTDISRQNLVQTSIAMENFVRGRLNRAVDNLLETAAISGTGSSNQPTGILTVSGTNDITIGTNGGPLTWALAVQFETETAIDNADMGKLGYLFTPGVAGLLKTTKRDVAGNGFIMEGPNMGGIVNGYRARASNFMPSTLTKGTSSGVCHAVIFGNWEELLIGQWGGMDLIVNPFTKSKEALIEMTVHSWWDLGVRHVLSFCKCDEVTLS